MASLPPFQQTSTPVSFPITWETIIQRLNLRCNEAYSGLKAEEPLDAVFRSALSLQQCNQEILDIHAMLLPEQLDAMVVHMPVAGFEQGMGGEGVLLLQLYYVNQWLALAFQRLQMWDFVVARMSWALEIAEDNGQHFCVPWEVRAFLRRIRDNPRLPITGYAAAKEGQDGE